MNMSSPSKAEKAYWGKLANIVGCIACRLDGIANHHVSIHHCAGRTTSGCHRKVLTLCAAHHQTGGEGIAIHPFKKQWEARYGTQQELMDMCNEILMAHEAKLIITAAEW
jgi:hypothetical protein